jgi:hypothetical protein
MNSSVEKLGNRRVYESIESIDGFLEELIDRRIYEVVGSLHNSIEILKR